MRLKPANADDVTELIFPDMSGEAFRHLWEDRQWEEQYDEVARSTTGALMFIHPNRVQHPARIAEIPVPGEVTALNQNQTRNRIEWHPSQAATSVQMVEFLQLF